MESDRRAKHRVWVVLAAIVLGWAAAAYLAAPTIWKFIYRLRRMVQSGPRTTQTKDGHPGDPVNIALQGTEEEVVRAMTAAGWHPADPITFATSVRIVVDSVVRKPDDQAPVSSLYLFGRREDLAFELPVGNSPRQRHHVRFWKWNRLYEGREAWFGSASFDQRVGLSHTTGEVTHHILPEVDAERDLIMKGIAAAGWAGRKYFIDGFHQELEGRNGGGDRWWTDGRLGVVDLAPPGR
jgi:LssY C-terminus